MKWHTINFIIFFCLSSSQLFCQNPGKIRVKRDNQFIYFFQKGLKSDTITKSKGHLFYLLVPDTLKESISVQTENGQLVPLVNDSLVKFHFLKGMKYELVYRADDEKAAKKKFRARSRINGAVENPHNWVLIKIIDKRENSLLSENRFFFRE